MNRQRIIRVAAIVAVAGATGFVMQSQDKGEQAPRIAAASVPPATPGTAAPAAAPAGAAAMAAPQAPAGALSIAATPPQAAASAAPPASAVPAVPADPRPAPEQAAAAEPAPQAATTPALATAAPACSEDMALIAQPGAMLDLGLLAPCRPGQRVLIRHGGLVVTGQTSAAGTLIASIPALGDPAEVTLAFADGTTVSETAAVPDLAGFDRFGVQWMEGDAFQLHALHRKTGAEVFGDTTATPSPQGGFLSRLGDATAQRPLLAEVYTFPAGTRALSGEVDLTIESAVTPATCGREILGETLQLTGGRLVLRDLTIEMPGCEAVGEYVVLPNPVAPEKLASN